MTFRGVESRSPPLSRCPSASPQYSRPVAVRFGYQALTGPLTDADARDAMWAFAGGVVAAGVTLTGLFFTRGQVARSEQRLALETTVNCLKLVMANDGKHYAPRGVVAGAIATLVHLNHPVIAMRTLAACWNDDAVDVPSATWLISEIFEGRDYQAQLEAAAMLDAHARELCSDTPGSFSWPTAIEYRWLASASPLPARLRVLRAILRVLVSKPRSWWREGGREGWAAALLYDVMSTDKDPTIREHAATYVETLLSDTQLTAIQTRDGWLSVEAVRERAAATAKPTQQIVMLRASEDELRSWATRVISPKAPS